MPVDLSIVPSAGRSPRHVQEHSGRYGIVRMEKVRRNIRPVVEATDFMIRFGLDDPERHRSEAPQG